MKEIKLLFLGKTYTQFQKEIFSVDYQKTACYRGQKYNLHAPIVIFPKRSPQSIISVSIYKYRGVSYIVEHHQLPTKLDETLVCHQ